MLQYFESSSDYYPPDSDPESGCQPAARSGCQPAMPQLVQNHTVIPVKVAGLGLNFGNRTGWVSLYLILIDVIAST